MGGQLNAVQTNSTYSLIGGGNNNNISGSLTGVTILGGNHITANHTGTLLWSDSNSLVTPLASSANDQATFACAGGMRVFTNTAYSVGAERRWRRAATTWAAISARLRNRKHLLGEVDYAAMRSPRWRRCRSTASPTRMRAARALSIRVPWRKSGTRAFRAREGELKIDTLDFDGVTLAALRGLADENTQLKKRVATLEERLERGSKSFSTAAANRRPEI